MPRTRLLGPVLGAAILAAIGSFAMASPARAECPEGPWFPPVTEAVRSAREVIIGKVLGSDGAGGFRLRIDYVLRGSPRVGDVRDITGLRSNWPESLNCTILDPSVDSTIAIAFDALADDGRTRYNAASWIYGMPGFLDVERTSLDELWYLASLPQTDSVTVDDTGGAPATRPSRGHLLLLVFLASTLVLARILSGRRQSVA